MSAAELYQRYRAPVENGQTLSVPPWQAVGDLLASNQAYRKSHSAEIQGLSLLELSKRAREEVTSQALAYTRCYADVEQPIADSPLILTGHQPELVHPGVWLKDFAAARIASQADGIAISLIVDSDLCRAPSIRVPTGSPEQPRIEFVAYDQAIDPIPLEERSIVDQPTWDSFGTRVAKAIAPFVPSPLINEWWPKYASSQTSEKLGRSIAQARHRLEIDWGNQSLNLPQSYICQTTSFRWFTAHLLANAEKFRLAYNGALSEYRQVHRLRNHAQPTPDLASNGGMVETPFWIWTAESPQRRGLFVQQRSGELLLTDRAGFERLLPLSSDSEAATAIEQLAEWESQGIKIRTRALLTTMYSRLVLADLFIHGIGGAKYDQVTDAICESFFGFSASPYLTLSGTLRLPIAHPTTSPLMQRQLRQELRELTYHPETETAQLALGADEQSAIDKIVAEKLSSIRTLKTPHNASERHRRIVAANQALQQWLAPRRSELNQSLAATSRQLRASQVLESREYPFCLFPQNDLRNFLLDF